MSGCRSISGTLYFQNFRCGDQSKYWYLNRGSPWECNSGSTHCQERLLGFRHLSQLVARRSPSDPYQRPIRRSFPRSSRRHLCVSLLSVVQRVLLYRLATSVCRERHGYCTGDRQCWELLNFSTSTCRHPEIPTQSRDNHLPVGSSGLVLFDGGGGMRRLLITFLFGLLLCLTGKEILSSSPVIAGKNFVH